MKAMSPGLLVYGDNHLILRGPRPTPAEARALARHYGLSLAEIGCRGDLEGWRLSTKEFREELTWAVTLPADTGPTAAIVQLLEELAARGIHPQELSCAI